MARKLIGYARVSTDEQAAEGVSLEAQAARLQAYASLYGVELVGIEVDAGASAKGWGASLADTLVRRPALARALEHIRRGEAGGLLVVKLDRLTRSVRDLGGLVEQANKGGWDLVSVGEQIDTASAAGRLVLHVLGAVAAWEREAVGERTAEALRHKATRGEFTGGEAPYGWTVAADGVHLEPVATEQTVMAEALALRAAGLSLRKIGAALEARGTLSRSGRSWSAAAVARVLAAKVAA